MTEYFFQTRQLTVGYNGKPLIRDIEIRLKPGQILTLIGPNGSGKSTILKTAARHLEKIHGGVYLGGRSTDGMTGRELALQTAVMFTEGPRPPGLTCYDVAAGGRYPHTGLLGVLSGQDKGKVRAALQRVHAWGLRDQDFTRVSDGQRQRVLLARALCQEPKVILLDEPTSYLDIRHALDLLALLRALAEEGGITVILSLHELDMAQKISDLVLCVKGEYVARVGTPEEIFQRDWIAQLYDLSGGSYNPLFGSFELARPAGAARVFVIAGGGTGIPAYRALQKKQTPFVTGVLHENDVDYQVARDLAAETFAEKSFRPIGEAVFQQALARLATCGAVLNCLETYGEMNEKNRLLYQQAAALGLADFR
jgi:iron complex transport system ATP-binding protein